MDTQSTQVALAVLYRENRYLMQLRDRIPGILYPGFWGLFGGHLERDESPDEGIRRELREEIAYCPPHLDKFGCDSDPGIVRHIYHGALTVPLEKLILGEGWDMGLMTPEQVREGEAFSVKANEVRPLGTPHQRIVLSVINAGLG
ncbi:MAG: NUDIX domain-containing protein [Roseofilum sp. SBFL]|uniref:NUDIX hydrolase n=1 Tax=unclassified Roseofilum TaxID=2620099 RepID=UPI001B21F616|nr:MULTISPECIES: NUDIX domain-containing protein [unclassified Roseofilum]MBP0013414.1 NUDIX domain-containing protein [Roseofilum sp. SID3]MBP0022874.1 NUDIX domain-containing protein [Roseofilum sp. SID2]MBP0036353.1 NUDIX domain-containing protein [Roseofilum sp. SID1]MBP0043205.1 NUDIX domain-containing protein [Roseofilum sp. SBFL]